MSAPTESARSEGYKVAISPWRCCGDRAQARGTRAQPRGAHLPDPGQEGERASVNDALSQRGD